MIYLFSFYTGTNCDHVCPVNSCEAGQHCRLVRGIPVCGVVGLLRQQDEQLDGWWANYVLQDPKQSNVDKRTNVKKANSIGESTTNHINRSPSKVLSCPPSSCASGLSCRMVNSTPVCFVASPLTIGLRESSNK